jgi:hypothetical protein
VRTLVPAEVNDLDVAMAIDLVELDEALPGQLGEDGLHVDVPAHREELQPQAE